MNKIRLEVVDNDCVKSYSIDDKPLARIYINCSGVLHNLLYDCRTDRYLMIFDGNVDYNVDEDKRIETFVELIDVILSNYRKAFDIPLDRYNVKYELPYNQYRCEVELTKDEYDRVKAIDAVYNKMLKVTNEIIEYVENQ